MSTTRAVRRHMRYFIGFLVTIGLIVLLIVLLFHGGNSGKVPQTKVPLIDYASTDTVVRETTDEIINAPDNHRTIEITVGRDNTTLNVIKGYDGESTKNLSYPMTQAGYAVFLKALQHAGFTLGNDDTKLQDERGYCPMGKRYIFEVIQGGDSIQRYWTTTCGGSVPSTFKGNTETILDLFQNQVPDYQKQVSNTELF